MPAVAETSVREDLQPETYEIDEECLDLGEEQAGDEAGARHQKRGCMHEGNTAAGGGILGAWGRHAMESERQWH